MNHSVNRPEDEKEDKAAIAPEARALPDDLKRATRALKTLSAGNHTLLHAMSETQLLEDMCRVIVEKGGYRQAGIAYAANDEAKSIRWMTSMGFDKGFLEAISFTWADTELGHTATGTAIRTGKPCVGKKVLTDPLYAKPPFLRLREDAIRNGYALAAAFPLVFEGEVLGALLIDAPEQDAFDAEEVELLSELAADLAFGIATLRTRVKHLEAQRAIARLAYYDSLTSLPNRTSLLEKLNEAMQEARQRHHALALLHLEVGRFHEINKVLGYRSGDQLLIEISARLVHAIRENETLARVGEAEFALLLPQASAEHAIQAARKLIAILHEPVEVSSLMVDAQVGIGIALFPGHAADAETLLRRANAAMHQAKPARGNYAVYTGGQEQEHTRRLALMSDLRRAIDKDELLLYCQPKVCMANRSVRGAEALVRWQHPLYGMISTGEFIKLAEQAGLITPLTHWVMESAFRQSYAWQESGLERTLSINLSAHDLRDVRLIDRIQGLFLTWGICPERIEFELTESALMEDPESALDALGQLKRLGVRLFIDDFGTGYSSLSYLQKLPVDSIKIDQSFVIPMISSTGSNAIVCSTIELGHNLNLEVVAEGVESQAIWDRLATLNCDVAQGYHISMPIPADQFMNWENGWTRAAHGA